MSPYNTITPVSILRNQCLKPLNPLHFLAAYAAGNSYRYRSKLTLHFLAAYAAGNSAISFSVCVFAFLAAYAAGNLHSMSKRGLARFLAAYAAGNGIRQNPRRDRLS